MNLLKSSKPTKKSRRKNASASGVRKNRSHKKTVSTSRTGNASSTRTTRPERAQTRSKEVPSSSPHPAKTNPVSYSDTGDSGFYGFIPSDSSDLEEFDDIPLDPASLDLWFMSDTTPLSSFPEDDQTAVDTGNELDASASSDNQTEKDLLRQSSGTDNALLTDPADPGLAESSPKGSEDSSDSGASNSNLQGFEDSSDSGTLNSNLQGSEDSSHFGYTGSGRAAGRRPYTTPAASSTQDSMDTAYSPTQGSLDPAYPAAGTSFSSASAAAGDFSASSAPITQGSIDPTFPSNQKSFGSVPSAAGDFSASATPVTQGSIDPTLPEDRDNLGTASSVSAALAARAFHDSASGSAQREPDTHTSPAAPVFTVSSENAIPSADFSDQQEKHSGSLRDRSKQIKDSTQERNQEEAARNDLSPQKQDDSPAKSRGASPIAENPANNLKKMSVFQIIGLVLTIAGFAVCILIIMYFRIREEGKVPNLGIITKVLETQQNKANSSGDDGDAEVNTDFYGDSIDLFDEEETQTEDEEDQTEDEDSTPAADQQTDETSDNTEESEPVTEDYTEGTEQQDTYDEEPSPEDSYNEDSDDDSNEEESYDEESYDNSDEEEDHHDEEDDDDWEDEE